MSETKALPVAEFKVLDETQGIVESLVAVSGIEDKVADIIEPGALGASLDKVTPIGVWSHDWDTPVSKVLEARELYPGDPNLPETKADGSEWPSKAGALYVKAQYNLDTQAGREAFSWAKFMGAEQQWSIGYTIPRGGSKVDEKSGIRHIKEISVMEYSQVIHGANPVTRSLTVKDLRAHYENVELEDELVPHVKALLEQVAEIAEDGEELDGLFDDEAEKVAVETDEDVAVETDEDVAVEDEKSFEAKLAEALAEALGATGDVDAVVERAIAIKDGLKFLDVKDGIVAGSLEEVADGIGVALVEAGKDLFGDASGTPRVVATFSDSVVAAVYVDGEDKHFHVAFEHGEDGVKFAEVSEAKLSAEVASTKSWDSVMTEIKDSRDVQVAAAEKLMTAVKTLVDLLAAAGIDLDEVDTDTEDKDADLSGETIVDDAEGVDSEEVAAAEETLEVSEDKADEIVFTSDDLPDELKYLLK
jgi:hypothetical protein